MISKFRLIVLGSIISILFSVMTVKAEVVKNAFGGSPWIAFPGSYRLTPAFPDKASRYDLLNFKPATGEFDALKVTGQFPHARYFGLNLYDYNEATDFAGLADRDIMPDEGSINPFEIGADRSAENRTYTIWLVKEGAAVPEGAKNIMTYPDGIETLAFMTRVYRSDKGLNLLGGVPLPVVEAIKLDGQDATAPKVGIDAKGLQSKLKMFLFNLDIITTWNLQKEFAGDEIVFNRISDAGLFPNAHNEYVTAPLEQCYWNKVAVLTLKEVPTAEDTYEGGNFEGDTDVRYWSFCTGGLAETGTPDCLCDDQVNKNEDGTVTIVIAPYYLKSSVKKAGLNYMKWGLVYKPIIIHRHMLARDGFEGRIGNVAPIGRPPAEEDRNEAYLDAHNAKNWMGDYTPKGYIYTVKEFKEKLNAGEFHTAFE